MQPLRNISLLLLLVPLLILFYSLYTWELADINVLKNIITLSIYKQSPAAFGSDLVQLVNRTEPEEEELKPPKPTKLPRPLKRPFVKRIVAIGDLYGDYKAMMEVLKFSKVINVRGTDEQGRPLYGWSGKVDVLVQTGNIMDLGAYGALILKFMDKLRIQAEERGQKVISLFGQHEFMNVAGDFSDVSTDEWKGYLSQLDDSKGKAYKARLERIRSANADIGKLWQYYDIAHRLDYYPLDKDDSKAFASASVAFVHAGLSLGPELENFPSGINDKYKKVWDILRSPIDDSKKPSYLQGLFKHGSISVLTNSDWAERDDENLCSDIRKILKTIGARRLIMGHTAHGEITSRCNGEILLIDTGMSYAIKKRGQRSALQIVYTITPPSEDVGFWTETEVGTALYPTSGSSKLIFRNEPRVLLDGEIQHWRHRTLR